MHIQHPKPIHVNLRHVLRQRAVDPGLLVPPRVLLTPVVQEGRDEGKRESVFFGPFRVEGGVGAGAGGAGKAGEGELLGEGVEVGLGDGDLGGLIWGDVLGECG